MKGKQSRPEMLWRSVCAVQGGTSLLIRSLGRVGSPDWLLPSDEVRLLTASYKSRDGT